MSADVTARQTITTLLQAAPGEQDVMDRLLPLVYDRLREMAHRQLRRERPGHTLSTTALVHEAYVKLVDQDQITAQGQTYFFGAAARAMRQVLVDYARRRQRQKRGGGQTPETLEDLHLAVDDFAAELLDLDAALNRLASQYPRQARVVECRFFGGLTVEETAEVLDVSSRTIKHDWALAKAWLFRALHHA